MEHDDRKSAPRPGEVITQPDYLNRRMELDPQTLVNLFQYHNKNLYADPETALYTYNGYLVLSAEGDRIDIPTSPGTLEQYENVPGPGAKPRAQMKLRVLYDVLNRMILEASCDMGKYDKTVVAEEQIARVQDTIGEGKPYMVLMGHGYASLPFFARMIEQGIYFVVRLKASDFKGEKKALAGDREDVTMNVMKYPQPNQPGGEGPDSGEDSFQFRMVCVWPDGSHRKECEFFATNLPRDQFPARSFEEIYRIRWKHETAFHTLRECLHHRKIYTGTEPRLVEQDIFGTIYICNVVEDIARNAEHEQPHRTANDYRHRLAAPRDLREDLLKNDLIYLVMQEDTQTQDQIMMRIYQEITNRLLRD